MEANLEVIFTEDGGYKGAVGLKRATIRKGGYELDGRTL